VGVMSLQWVNMFYLDNSGTSVDATDNDSSTDNTDVKKEDYTKGECSMCHVRPGINVEHSSIYSR